MNISINAPSYKRAKVEILDYLPFVKIWVDHKEYDEYIKQNKGFENNIISCPEGIQGNVSRIRNYILDKEFEKGADVICIIDDDLRGIYRFEPSGTFGYDKIKIEADVFENFIEKYTSMCNEFGFKLWGVGLNQDSLSYRQQAPFNTKAIILGPFSCHLNSDIRYDEKLPLKEDYDLAIQHLNKYRGILRINKYFYNAKQSKQAGGCASYRNHKREQEQLQLLMDKWGDKIIKIDIRIQKGTKKQRVNQDYNPIIKIPIRGV